MPLMTDHFARLALRARGWRSHKVPTRHGPVHAMEARGHGKGSVVILHGFSSAGTQMAWVLQRLRPFAARVYAPDLPAHGFSAVPPEGDGALLDTMLEGAHEALDALLQEPAVLVGTSMGGAVAIRYAVLRPEKVRALVLLAPGGAPMTDEELGPFRDQFRVRSHADALAFVDRVFARRNPLRPVFAVGIRLGLQRPVIQGLIDQFEASRLLRPDELSRLTMPVHVLWGAQDGVLPAHGEEFFRAHLPPEGTVEVLKEVGHSPHLEATDRVLQVIRSMLPA